MNDELERIWKEEFRAYWRYRPSIWLEVVSETRRTLGRMVGTPVWYTDVSEEGTASIFRVEV
jgi:hypothetical protein